MSTDLATTADVVARLGRSLTDTEALRVTALLKDSSASVRNYTRQHFTETETTDALVARNGRVVLPQRPATAIGGVLSPAGAPVAYVWPGTDYLVVAGALTETWSWQFEPFVNGPPPTLTVTYTHGYETIPDDIVGVVCSIVLRAIGREPLDAGITSETIQGYSYALGTTGAAGPFGLLQPERDVLDSYTRTGGRVNTSP